MGRAVHLPADAAAVFATGLSQIRAENEVPASFPPAVLEAADAAAKRPLGSEHFDRTDLGFVTLDPATSTDLDQAFTIEQAAGGDLLLRYAIADVSWFVRDGDPLDNEAWTRGVTTYMPDGRAGLYPPALSEAVASLLPDGPRPAVVFIVRVRSNGDVSLDGAERALIHSRAKLAYETASADRLPAAFDEFAARIAHAEDRRGASRTETPEQEVVADVDSGYHIEFRPRLVNEDANAAMSLATNMAVAAALLAAHSGLFRVMPEPDDARVRSLRYTARALGLQWPENVTLRSFERTLGVNSPANDPATNPVNAAFLIAARRAAGGASYAPYAPGVIPWHSAMAATYSHGTAPLRRLADRYVVAAALAVANGRPVPDELQQAFTRLPAVMEHAETRASRIERSVIDMVEAVMLHGREGQSFDAVVVDHDDRGARIQLCDPAVVARVSAHGVRPGDNIRVRLVSSDTSRRVLTFERVS